MGIKGIGGNTMSILSTIFSGGASTLVESVGKVLDDVITTKEEKGHLDNEIRKAQMQFEVDMRKMSIDEKRMVIEDTGNARNREIQVAQSEHATKLSKNVSPYLALGTTGITLVLFFVLIFRSGTVPESSKDIILYILGVLSAVLTQIYSYYFGSSASSAAKDVTISGIKNK